MVPQRNYPPLTLKQLQEHATDPQWLADHYEIIRNHIRQGLSHNQDVIGVVQMLNVITPYVMSRPDFRDWTPSLYNAMVHAMNLHDDELMIQLWSHLGSIELQAGNYKTARVSLEKALQQRETSYTEAMRFLARIGMLSLNGAYYADDINAFIAESLAAAGSIDNPYLLARLYFTLGLAYVHQGEALPALQYGQIAYAYWRKLGDKEAQNRTLVMLAEACRVEGHFQQSQHFLDYVTDDLSQLYTSALKLVQKGATYRDTGQWAAAEAALGEALGLLESLEDYPYLRAIAQHTLGITQTLLGKYTPARANLSSALYLWQESRNLYQHANVTHALAYLSHQEGDFDTARALYHDALRLLDNVASSVMVARVRQAIQDDMADLPE